MDIFVCPRLFNVDTQKLKNMKTLKLLSIIMLIAGGIGLIIYGCMIAEAILIAIGSVIVIGIPILQQIKLNEK